MIGETRHREQARERTIRTNAKHIIFAIAAVVLTGCEMDVTPEVYVSDVREMANNGTTGLTTPATISIEIPSTNKCPEYTARVAEVMTGILDNYEPKGCTKSGMESYLVLAVQMPLTPEGHANDSLFHIGVSRDKGETFEGKLHVFLLLNPGKFQMLNGRMRDKFHGSVDLSKSKIQLKLHNDERRSVECWASGSFLNGEPVYDWMKISLERRRTAEIVLSNVQAAFLEKHGYARLAMLSL